MIYLFVCLETTKTLDSLEEQIGKDGAIEWHNIDA